MSVRPVVLLTGAGGVYGDATIGDLRRSSLEVDIIAADTCWHASGLLRSDHARLLPKVDDPDYVSRLIAIVRESRVNVVFICSGTEIRTLVGMREQLERETQATFILPDGALYGLASDKLETVRFLEAKGFDYPATILEQRPRVARGLHRQGGLSGRREAEIRPRIQRAGNLSFCRRPSPYPGS